MNNFKKKFINIVQHVFLLYEYLDNFQYLLALLLFQFTSFL